MAVEARPRETVAVLRRPSPLVLLTLLGAALPAQVAKPSQEALLAQELASPFLAKAPWTTDYDAALDLAKERHTLVFAYFTTVEH